jgi:hypothetical protein
MDKVALPAVAIQAAQVTYQCGGKIFFSIRFNFLKADYSLNSLWTTHRH